MENLLEYAIIISIIFAATTILYLVLYRKISSKLPEPRALSHEQSNANEEFAKLGGILPNDHVELNKLLEELRQIKKRAEILLNEESSENRRSNYQKSPQ